MTSHTFRPAASTPSETNQASPRPCCCCSLPAHRASPLTIDDYLLLEEASATRHEYVAGQVHALAGTTKRHNTIAGNIHALLWQAMGDGPCRVFIGDVKLRAGSDAIYYPDVMVVCEPDEEAGPLIVEAPCLVVEVISPSSIRTDRVEKRDYYMSAGVPEYWVADCDARVIERWNPERETPSIVSATLTWRPFGAKEPLDIEVRRLFERIWSKYSLLTGR